MKIARPQQLSQLMKDGDWFSLVRLWLLRVGSCACEGPCPPSQGEDAEVPPLNPAAMPVLLGTPCGARLGHKRCHLSATRPCFPYPALLFPLSQPAGALQARGSCPQAFVDRRESLIYCWLKLLAHKAPGKCKEGRKDFIKSRERRSKKHRESAAGDPWND